MEERRGVIRRQYDRELLQRVGQLVQPSDRRTKTEGDDAKRKRRRAVRHNCKVGIKMPIKHSAGTSDTWSHDSIKVDGRLLDLSPEGASLFTKQPFETAQELQLAIMLQDKTKISTMAVVRWVKSIPEKKGFASGVRLMDVAEKDQKRIIKFLDRLDATAGL